MCASMACVSYLAADKEATGDPSQRPASHAAKGLSLTKSTAAGAAAIIQYDGVLPPLVAGRRGCFACALCHPCPEGCNEARFREWRWPEVPEEHRSRHLLGRQRRAAS